MSFLEDEVRRTDLFKAVDNAGMKPRFAEGTHAIRFIFTLPDPQTAKIAKTDLWGAIASLNGFKIHIKASDVYIGASPTILAGDVSALVAGLDQIYREQIKNPTWLSTPIRQHNKISSKLDTSKVMEIISNGPSMLCGGFNKEGAMEFADRLTTTRGFQHDTSEPHR